MSVSAIGSATPIPAESQPVVKAPVSQAPSTPQPADTVSISPAAQKAVGGDVDHDGDSH